MEKNGVLEKRSKKLPIQGNDLGIAVSDYDIVDHPINRLSNPTFAHFDPFFSEIHRSDAIDLHLLCSKNIE